jgi:PKD repeat protein
MICFNDIFSMNLLNAIMKKYILLFGCVFANLVSVGQKESSWWFFGTNAGLHFQTNTVTILPGLSPLNGGWGYSSISDSSGNLMFYSHYSDYVFNKLHDTMANGIILGGIQGPQPSLIIRKSGSLYYLLKYASNNFFSPGISPMLSYSIIDMSKAAGNGSVTVTNVPITPAGIGFTKMAGTRHCNGQDYWLLTHRADMPIGNNQFYAYQVSSAGISSTPVISTIGSNQPHAYGNSLSFLGRMKFSPNGRKVCTVYPSRTVELYDFNPSSGQLTNVMKLDSSAIFNPTVWPYAYDVEFSPDGTKLYVNYWSSNNIGQTHPFLCQFDLSQTSAQAIAASKTVIDPGFQSASIRDMQLGLDGKIYIGSTTNSQNLSIIHNPNLNGLACNYDSVGINMGIIPGTSVQAVANRGLPSFVSNYFEQKPSFPAFTYTANCGLVSFYSPTVTAFPATGYSVNSYQWNFGDPVTGTSNTSTLSNPTHVFSFNGTYQIKLLLNYYCGTDTLKQTVNVSGLPSLSITAKSSMCKGETQNINFAGASSYSVNGTAVPQASSSIQPTVNTTYIITGFDSVSGCKVIKSFSVAVKPCTGISEVNTAEDQIRVYPNPHQNEIIIELKEEYQSVLMDFTGRVINEQKLFLGKNTLSTQENLSGIYFLRLVNENTSVTLKLVKE